MSLKRQSSLYTLVFLIHICLKTYPECLQIDLNMLPPPPPDLVVSIMAHVPDLELSTLRSHSFPSFAETDRFGDQEAKISFAKKKRSMGLESSVLV